MADVVDLQQDEPGGLDGRREASMGGRSRLTGDSHERFNEFGNPELGNGTPNTGLGSIWHPLSAIRFGGSDGRSGAM